MPKDFNLQQHHSKILQTSQKTSVFSSITLRPSNQVSSRCFLHYLINYALVTIVNFIRLSFFDFLHRCQKLKNSFQALGLFNNDNFEGADPSGRAV